MKVLVTATIQFEINVRDASSENERVNFIKSIVHDAVNSLDAITADLREINVSEVHVEELPDEAEEEALAKNEKVRSTIMSDEHRWRESLKWTVPCSFYVAGNQDHVCLHCKWLKEEHR